MALKLYAKDSSPPCRAVYMVLDLLNIKDVEIVYMNLLQKDHFKDEYLRMNPQHTIPTLKDGDFAIWDSHAIVTYLVNKYAADDALYPKDPQKRALIDQRLHFNNCILFAAMKETAIPVIYEGAKTYRPEHLAKLKSGYDFIESFLSGPYLTGDTITLADVCCVSTISSMNIVHPIDEKAYPKISAWLNRCAAQSFYKKCNEPGLKALREIFENAMNKNAQ